MDDFAGRIRVVAVSNKRRALQLRRPGMKSAHAGMGITNPEFDALIGASGRALNKCKVGEREQSDLISVC